MVPLRILPEFQGVLGYSEFKARTVMREPAPREAERKDWTARDWTDRDDLMLTEWLQIKKVPGAVDIAAQAVQAVAGEQPFHEVRDWLDSLEWDNSGRLDTWLPRYLGVRETRDDGSDLSPHIRAVGRCWLIGAVARVYRPSCKVDSLLILEGTQGIGKSRALKILAGDFFTDPLGDIGSKEAAEQLPGVWQVELAELESMSGPEIARIKAFLSCKTDRFREAYGRRVATFPRQCVFAGSTNGDHYLKDPSGARRFWPVKCRRIDLEGVEADRDQLWAEAAAYHGEEDWWLTHEQQRAYADDEQAKRFVGDPSEESTSN